MLILAGALGMDGGATFVLRYAETLQNEQIDVLVLNRVIEQSIFAPLKEIANVFFMSDTVSPMFSGFAKNQTSIFLPIRKKMVQQLLERNNYRVHVMGIFGLVLAYKWLSIWPAIKITAGVYHQNEFFFDSKDFFVNEVKQMLAQLPEENMIFFDEYTRILYAHYFNTSFSASLLAPIGIKVPDINFDINRRYIPGKIVSVGNLNTFKTYNHHMISVIADLIVQFPFIYYEIYGAGEEFPALQELVQKLKLEKHVFFKGIIKYKNFADVVSDAMVFIGSGTALLEAASLGIPAIIGIESIKTPQTYGFIYEVPGFTYNEMTSTLPLYLIRSRVEVLLHGDAQLIEECGRKCHHKAQEFSMTVTVSGFKQLANNAKTIQFSKRYFFWLKMFFGFIKIALFDALNLDKQFKNRRNHSSQMKES